MALRNFWASYKISSLFTSVHGYRLFAGKPSQTQYRDVLFSNVGYSCSTHQGLRLICTSAGSSTGAHIKLKDKVDKVQPLPVPPSSSPRFYMWAKWILGSVLTFLLHFWQQKLNTLLRLEGKAEEVVEEVENVAEEIEKVATTTEKISAEVAAKIPFNGKLKDAALCIEHVSSVTAKDAQQVLDLIHKVDELKQDLKDLETFVEPVIDKLKEKEDEEK